MQIGVVGSTKTGKSTFIEDFINKFPKYGQPAETYRDIPDLELYDNGTQESQKKIRDFMYNQAETIWRNRDTDRKVIQDRTLLDNLAVTMYLYGKYPDRISDEFLLESIQMTKRSMSFYHLIYFIPISKHDKINVPEDIDKDFRSGFDTILKTFWYSYKYRDDLANDIFPNKNCTAIEEILGSRSQRIALVSEILDEDGELLGDISNEVNPTLYGSDGCEIGNEGLDAEYTMEDFIGSMEDMGIAEETIDMEVKNASGYNIPLREEKYVIKTGNE